MMMIIISKPTNDNVSKLLYLLETRKHFRSSHTYISRAATNHLFWTYCVTLVFQLELQTNMGGKDEVMLSNDNMPAVMLVFYS